MKLFNIKFFFLIMMTSSALSTTSCSYIMDSIEGAITNRASFGINVTKGAGTITVSWNNADTGIDSEAFAGFEVYISPANDDSREDILVSGPVNSGAIAANDTSLLSMSTNSVTVTYTPSTGIHFLRVGVIYWGEEKASKRTSNWSGWNETWRNNQPANEVSLRPYYMGSNGYTKLKKISGSAEVAF